ncbi:hypothetical protein JK32_00008 [Shigella phage JK32]|nr:hypothetical protein JK32_00008 [Shigella phage JK32]
MSHILDNHSIFNMIVAAVFVAVAVSYGYVMYWREKSEHQKVHC